MLFVGSINIERAQPTYHAARKAEHQTLCRTSTAGVLKNNVNVQHARSTIPQVQQIHYPHINDKVALFDVLAAASGSQKSYLQLALSQLALSQPQGLNDTPASAVLRSEIDTRRV